MIRIRPTTESGLSHASYAIDLPGSIIPIRPRAKKVATTIDGGVAISLWRKRTEGAELSKDFLLHPDKYAVLKAIVYHETIFEWLVMSDENRYICEIDITKDEKQSFNGDPEYHNVTLNFLVVEQF